MIRPQKEPGTRAAILKSIEFAGFYCVRTHMSHHTEAATLLRSMEREGILIQSGRDGSKLFYKKAAPKVVPIVKKKRSANKGREVQQLSIDGTLIRTFTNAEESSKSGYSPKVVAQSCQKHQYYAGCRWRYTPITVTEVPCKKLGDTRADNKSGVPGVFENVSKTDRGKPWTAVMTIKGKNTTKRFRTKEEAVYQRKLWEREHYVGRS